MRKGAEGHICLAGLGRVNRVKITFAVVVLPFVLLLNSCSQAFHYLVFNNTGSEMTVRSTWKNFDDDGKGRTVVPAGESIIVDYRDTLGISIPGKTRNYDRHLPRARAYVDRTATPPIVRIQVETNGVLHVLPPNWNRIMRPPPTEQPDGFPLKPRRNSTLQPRRAVDHELVPG